MVELAVFAVVTGFLGVFSRCSLTRMQSHGYFRFLAWGRITALAILIIRV